MLVLDASALGWSLPLSVALSHSLPRDSGLTLAGALSLGQAVRGGGGAHAKVLEGCSQRPAPLPWSGSPTPGSAWAVAAGPRTSASLSGRPPPHYLTSQQKALLMLQRKAEVNFKQMLNKSPLLEGVQSHILLSYRF